MKQETENMVTPPLTHIQHMGLHWVKCRHDSNPFGWEYLLLQWNPGSQTWTRYNEHDTVRRPTDLKRYVYHSPAPLHMLDPYAAVEGVSPGAYPREDIYKQALFELNSVLSILEGMKKKAELEAVKAAVELRLRDLRA